MTNFTDLQLMAIIDRSLKATAAEFKAKKRRPRSKAAVPKRKARAKRRTGSRPQ